MSFGEARSEEAGAGKGLVLLIPLPVVLRSRRNGRCSTGGHGPGFGSRVLRLRGVREDEAEGGCGW